MNKIALLALIASGALSTPIWASSVAFSASPASRDVVDPNGTTTVATGSLIWEGMFSNTGSFVYNPALSIAANVANIQTANGWTQFTLTATTNTLMVKNSFGQIQAAGSVTDNSANANSFNPTKQVYLWVFNATTVGASTEMGIFTSGSWTFPTNAGGVGDTATYDTTSGTAMSAAVGAITNSGGPGGTGTLTLAAGNVPEPSSVVTLLGAGGLMAMLRRRRSGK